MPPALAKPDERHAVRIADGFARIGVSFNRPKDWQAFERLSRDLFARITGDVHTDLHGRAGQPQAGVDVFGTDQRSRARFGVQCRGRGDGSAWAKSRLTAKELRSEVERAHAFRPKLDLFVILTTAPNDARLQRAAAELNAGLKRSGSFEVRVHGWDWIEGKLGDHFDLAIKYGLIAVIEEVARKSKIDREIGDRLASAIELMNQRRKTDDRFTIQSISKYLGLPDWRRLESLVEGRCCARMPELARIAEGLGINEQWLIEGKAAPFAVDPGGYRGAEEQFELISRLKPQSIIFARESDDPFDSIVVARINDFRWIAFSWDHPTSGHVGGIGRRQLFEYCCLIRQLFRSFEYPGGCPCYGRHLDPQEFRLVQEGETYPGMLFHWTHNDHWWMDFAELADGRVQGNAARDEALRDAIHIVRDVLAEFQEHAARHSWMRDALRFAGFPMRENGPSDRYALRDGLSVRKRRKQ